MHTNNSEFKINVEPSEDVFEFSYCASKYRGHENSANKKKAEILENINKIAIDNNLDLSFLVTMINEYGLSMFYAGASKCNSDWINL